MDGLVYADLINTDPKKNYTKRDNLFAHIVAYILNGHYKGREFKLLSNQGCLQLERIGN